MRFVVSLFRACRWCPSALAPRGHPSAVALRWISGLLRLTPRWAPAHCPYHTANPRTRRTPASSKQHLWKTQRLPIGHHQTARSPPSREDSRQPQKLALLLQRAASPVPCPHRSSTARAAAATASHHGGGVCPGSHMMRLGSTPELRQRMQMGGRVRHAIERCARAPGPQRRPARHR